MLGNPSEWHLLLRLVGDEPEGPQVAGSFASLFLLVEGGPESPPARLGLARERYEVPRGASHGWARRLVPFRNYVVDRTSCVCVRMPCLGG